MQDTHTRNLISNLRRALSHDADGEQLVVNLLKKRLELAINCKEGGVTRPGPCPKPGSKKSLAAGGGAGAPPKAPAAPKAPKLPKAQAKADIDQAIAPPSAPKPVEPKAALAPKPAAAAGGAGDKGGASGGGGIEVKTDARGRKYCLIKGKGGKRVPCPPGEGGASGKPAAAAEKTAPEPKPATPAPAPPTPKPPAPPSAPKPPEAPAPAPKSLSDTANDASAKAYAASNKANVSNTKEDHEAATKAHAAAEAAHEAAGKSAKTQDEKDRHEADAYEHGEAKEYHVDEALTSPSSKQVSPTAARDMLHSTIDSSDHLTDKQKADFKDAVTRVHDAMPEEARRLMSQGCKQATFYGDRKGLTEDYGKLLLSKSGNDPDRAARAQKMLDGKCLVGGHFCSTDFGYIKAGTVTLDGMTSQSSSEGQLKNDSTNIHGTYAHELAHAIDFANGRQNAISNTPEWQAAYQKEIVGDKDKKPKLSGYARSSAHEGFAEFGRLVYGSNADMKKAEKQFPECFKVWRKHKLYDK